MDRSNEGMMMMIMVEKWHSFHCNSMHYYEQELTTVVYCKEKLKLLGLDGKIDLASHLDKLTN
jgi:hypothetical protein